MNYKIKITEQNREVVKRIADENEMNTDVLDFIQLNEWYLVFDGLVLPSNNIRSYEELTTKQFIELFDKKKETELEVWLMETKAKNLTHTQLYNFIDEHESCPKWIYNQLDGYGITEKTSILYDQWNTQEPTEWKPKRGERVLVWFNEGDKAVESIFLEEIKGVINPYLVVDPHDITLCLENKSFNTMLFKHMKPIPKEEPKLIEKDFKSKVVDLIENKLSEAEANLVLATGIKDYHAMFLWDVEITLKKVFLEQIKELN